MPLCPTRIPFSRRKLSASVLLKICSGSVSCSSASTDSQDLGTAECHTVPWASWGILTVITLGHKPSELWWYPEPPLKEQNSSPCSLIQLPSLVGSYKGLQTKVIKNNEMELQLRVHLTLKYPLYFLFLNCNGEIFVLPICTVQLSVEHLAAYLMCTMTTIILLHKDMPNVN